MALTAWARAALSGVFAIGIALIVGSGGGGGGGGETPAVAPTITGHPQSTTVSEGAAATFTVAATGTAPLAYQWRKNGSDIAGATSASYTLAAASLADHGAQFSALVSNSAGSAASNAATLSVSAVTGAPSITTQPQSASATGGQLVGFSVNATGAAPLSYQWQRNGVDILGATASTLTVMALTSDTGATYRVLVSNGNGTATSSAAVLSVSAAATGTLNGIGVSAANAGVWMAVTASVPGRPAATSTPTQSFNIPSVPASEHIVLRTAAAGHLEQLKIAAVRAGAVSLVRSTLWPIGTTTVLDAAAGGTAADSTAQVVFPANAFQRTADGAAPSGAVSVTVTALPGARDPDRLPGNGITLAGGARTWLDSLGAVAITAVDATGSTLRLAAGKTVAVRIPASQRDTSGASASATTYRLDPHDATWTPLGSATLAGTGNARYFEATLPEIGYWQAARAADVIQVSGCTAAGTTRTRNRSVRAEGIDYNFASYAFTDTNGQFSVAVRRNSSAVLYTTGGTESTAPVVVGPSAGDITLPACLSERGTVTGVVPSFVVQPQSLTAAAGALVRLHAVADGATPMALQWRRNGVPIAGETGTALVFVAAASDQGAVFTVVATNAAGSTTSAAAVLTVTAAAGSR
jgi:hypothetical protein